MIKTFLTCLIAVCSTSVFALYEMVKETEPVLPLPNSEWREIGKIKNLDSTQIKGSRISIGMECLDRDMFEPEKIYDKLAKTGIKWARCQTGWGKTEKVKGVYDFKWLDDVVDNLVSRGIEPFFNLGFGNALYMGETKTPTAVGYVPLYFGDECLQAWKNYVDTISKRYKGKVRFYEIWNEPDWKGFWIPKKPDAAEYAKLIKITGEIIRQNVPDAQIGATTSENTGRPYQLDFFKSGGAEYIDFFCIHSYCTIPEERHDTEARILKDWLSRYGKGRKISIWQTEAGFGSYYPPKHFRKTVTSGGEYMQAKWMLRRTVLDISSGYALTSHFQCVDFKKGYQMGEGGNPLYARYGMFENITYKPKKIYNIVKNLTPILDVSTSPRAFFGYVDTLKAKPVQVGESRLLDTAKRVETFERNGYPMFAVWLAEDVQTQMKPIENCSFTYMYDEREIVRPVILDTISGRVFECIKPVSRDGNKRPRVDGFPLVDWPIFVTDFDAVKEIIELK